LIDNALTVVNRAVRKNLDFDVVILHSIREVIS
jgi:hypothetical protein